MHQQRPHLGHRHLRLFFPPTAAVAASKTTGPKATGLCGGANPPSHASHTHPGRTPPWPLENFARPTSGPRVREPTSPAAPPPARWSDGTSTRPVGPESDGPTTVLAPRAIPPH